MIAGAVGLVAGLFTSAPAAAIEPAGGDETAAQSQRHRRVPVAPDRRADPQQPARRREVPLAGCGAGDAHRQRAGEELHRAEPRVQVLGHRRRRTTGSASSSPSSASRSRRPKRSCRRYREQNDAISLEDRAEHRRPEAGRPERRGDAAKTERIQKEAMYKQLRAHREQSRGARHLPGDSQQHLHPAAEERAGAAAAAAARSCPRSSARSTRRSSRSGRRSRARS